MATELKLRRGTTSQHSTFTGAEAEVTVDTDKNTIVVHDGTTVGGYPALLANNVNEVSSAVTLDASNFGELIAADSTSSSFTITMPDPTVVGAGYQVAIKKVVDANTVTVEQSGSEGIDGAASIALENAENALQLRTDGTSWYSLRLINFEDAQEIAYDNSGSTLTATTVKDALDELDTNIYGTDLTWDSSGDTYTRGISTQTGITRVHEGMKRCLLLDDGTVNYYLDPTDSTLKEDGTSANLSGADGMVMVEIPRFYFRFEFEGNKRIWKVSDLPLAGYQLHPAFFKNGEIVDYRYMGAYDACVFDDSASAYISGTNLDENIGNVDLSNDKLASVSGIYPMVGLERDEFRALAANRGAGWRQQDFWLTSAVQMLYLVEYGDFNSQANLGSGNTNDSYIGSSSNQNDSPHTVAGASNGWGNSSTDGSQPSSGAKPGTAYMSYRGIENFFGNCWNFVDGLNVSIGSSGTWYVNNDDTTFADDTATNYELIADSMPSDGYVTDIDNAAGAFIPSSTGGSSSTFLADFFFDDNGNTNRVALFGGRASNGGLAGAFYWDVYAGSGDGARRLGGRLAY